jgi:hypothetical protein
MAKAKDQGCATEPELLPELFTEVIKKIILEIFSTIIQILYHSLLPKTIAPNGKKSLPEAPT